MFRFYVFCVTLPLVFVCLVTWECFGHSNFHAHTPLFFTKAFELSCVVYKTSSCVFCCLVTKEHLGRSEFRAPAHPLFTKAFELSWLVCKSSSCVHLSYELGSVSSFPINLSFSQNVQTIMSCVRALIPSNLEPQRFRVTIHTY